MFQKYFDKRLSKKLVNRIYKEDKKLWMDILLSFEEWKFPIEFYDLIPSWWCKNPFNLNREENIIKQISEVINKEFSKKDIQRYKTLLKGMPSNQFEYWFDNIFSMNFDSHKEYDKYYERKHFMETIHWWEDETFEKLEKTLKNEVDI